MSGKQSSATKQKKYITAIPAKIAPPRINNCFQRQRLFRLLDSYQDKPLVWISGPAGCGKTTLVASYLKSRNERKSGFALNRDSHSWKKVK